MNFAQTERSALCDLMMEKGPQAPTLCGDWTTHDLAAHLWVREADPLGAPGIFAAPLAGLTERRMDEARTRWSYAELLARLKAGPTRFSLFTIPGLDAEANSIEYFVHHEDVRRAGEDPAGARSLEASTEQWMWRRLRLLGRAMFRASPVGVVLERRGASGSDDEPETARVMAGNPTVTVVGTPSELMLFAYGRDEVAEVDLVGTDEAIARLRATDRGV